MEAENNDIVLYWGSGSGPCWRVQVVLDEKNLKYKSKMLSFERNEHKSEEILKLNPRGQFPTFKIGKHVINESFAACLYLLDTYKSQGSDLIPDESKAVVLQKAFEALNLQKYCQENIIYYIWRTPNDKLDENYLADKKKELNKELERWEHYLVHQNTKFIATDQFTLADVMFFIQLAFVVRMGYPLQRYPKLQQYYDAVKTRPSIFSNWPPHWKTTSPSTHLADCGSFL